MPAPLQLPRPLPRPVFECPRVNALINDSTMSGLYTFEHASVLEDLSGNSVHGAISGAVFRGPSLFFTNDSVNLGDNHDLANVSTAMSVFALAKINTLGSASMIVNKLASTPDIGWTLLMSGGGANNLRFRLFANNVANNADSAATIPQDEWFTAGGTYDGGGNRSGMTVYLNSVSTAGAAQAMANPVTNSENCTIGSDSPAAATFWPGNIGLVAIWIGKELTQEEISAMHNFALALVV